MMKFELSEEMVKIIAQCLGSSPYNLVAPVIAEMQRQIDAQKNTPVRPPSNGQSIHVDNE